MELLKLVLPANVQLVYDQVHDLINLELWPKEDLYDDLIAKPLDLETSDEIKQREANAALD